jgi:hypothetical protein
MSKFLDRLDKLSRGPTTALGFGAGGRTEKLPGMALIGDLSSGKRPAQSAATLSKIGADGALVQGDDPEGIPKNVAEALKDIPWGVRASALTADGVTGFMEKGCDFLAFAPDGAQVGALNDEDAGYVLCVPPDMDEQSLRAIEDLPVDAVLLALDSVDPPLTVQHLLAIGAVRGSFSKYFLLEVPVGLTSGELEGLKEMGVDGLVVDATAASAKEMTGLKDRLMSLPRRQRNRGRNLGTVHPRDSYAAPAVPAPAEDDDEDDEDF